MIKVENISMKFRMTNDNMSSLKEFAIAALKHKINYNDFWVFKNINFEVKKGEVVGIVGRNGAGKSTILKIISGILTPTTGKVTLNGNVVPMLELGSGFDQDLTGRENIFLNGSILGYSEEFLKEKYDEIVEFSELGEFIESPIRNYSSGMMMRLAFSIATIVQPEILIVDEILAVGDEAFQKKSKRKMLELMGGGTTVLFVSHSIDQIREMCNRVIWLEKGEVKMEGETKMVCDAYQKYINPVADDGDKKHKASDAPKFFSDVLFIYGEDEEAYDWRVTNIREQLQTGQMNSNEVYYENLSQDLVKKYRIFIFVGCSEEEGIIDFIKLAKKLNKTVIVDINKCNSDVIYFKHQNELLENVREYCDGVMVSNTYLQETYNAIGYTTILNELVTSERIAEYAAWSIYDRDVLPNMKTKYMSEDELINYNKACLVRNNRLSDGIRIGFFGDTLISDRFNLIINNVVDLMKNNGTLKLYAEDLEQRLPAELENYRSRIIFKSLTEKEDILRDFAEVDIAVFATRDAIEENDIIIKNEIYAGLVKVPYLAYSDNNSLEKDNVFNDLQSFESELQRLIDNRKLCEEIGQKLYVTIRNEKCAIYNCDEIVKVLKNLISENMIFSVVGDYWSPINYQVFEKAAQLQMAGKDVTIVCMGKEQKDIVVDDVLLPVVSRELIYFNADVDCSLATDCEGILWLQDYARAKKMYYYVTCNELLCCSAGDRMKMMAQKALHPYRNIEFVTTSKIIEEWLKLNYNISAMYVEPFIKLEDYRKIKKNNNSKHRLLIVGDCLNKNDNLDFAFNVVDRLDKNKFEVIFWAFGREPYKYYNYDKLYWELNKCDIIELYNICDILLVTCKSGNTYDCDKIMDLCGGKIVCSDAYSSTIYSSNYIVYEDGNIDSAVEAIEHTL